jgi:hypothetical protein
MDTNGNGMAVTSGAELRKKSRELVKCPETGNVYLMRKPTITDLIVSGALPENFVAKTLEAVGKTAEEEESEAQETRSLTDQDILRSEASKRAMITAGMLLPRIVENAVEDDEIEYKDIPASDRAHLAKWTRNELPEQNVETSNGQVLTVGAVETFPPAGQSDESSGSGNNGVEVGAVSIAAS